MKKILIVVDMQRDFVDGALGTEEARAIVPAVTAKATAYAEDPDGEIIFTQDTHGADYLDTQEGRNLPVPHCIRGTEGWEIIPELQRYAGQVFCKPAFGSTELVQALAGRNGEIAEIELIGLCTDICVVSNALLIKAFLPETPVSVDGACCAGVTPEKHLAALETLRSCQVRVD